MSDTQPIPGSVCAPRGFRAAGVAAGIKASGNADVALIVSDFPATAAAVFTTNRVCAAPVRVSRENLREGRARAVIVNAGNANAVTGEQGMQNARRMAQLTAEVVGCGPSEVVVASTGVIGRALPMDRVERGIRLAAGELSPDGDAAAARAIMTTDTRPKEIAVAVRVDGRPVRVGGICKGSGMIAPNMATMLAFLTTDAEVAPDLLRALLRDVTARTFNAVTVDGDTSTNDTLAILANGASDVRVTRDLGYDEFAAALYQVCAHLARELARDGEGATKLVNIEVRGARTAVDAHRVAKSVANSPLVKTALFGNDPNWGRILCAVGYSGVDVDPRSIDLTLAGVPLVLQGEPVPFDEASTSQAMRVPELLIEVDLRQGSASATVWTCDFSYDYVRINAEYTT